MLGEYGELYPEVPAEAWEPYRALYPELFADQSWRLPCACFLVRTEEMTVLVDTGVGPPGLWDWTAEDEGRLPEAIEALGVSRDEVDAVFLTHLHIDHVGWNTDLEGTLFFPRARYVVHRDAVAFALTQSGRPHVRRCVEPLVGSIRDGRRRVRAGAGPERVRRAGSLSRSHGAAAVLGRRGSSAPRRQRRASGAARSIRTGSTSRTAIRLSAPRLGVRSFPRSSTATSSSPAATTRAAVSAAS